VDVRVAGRSRLILGGGAAALVDPELADYSECAVPVGLRHQVRAVWRVNTRTAGWRHPVFPDGYGDVVVTDDLRILAVGPARRVQHKFILGGSTVMGVRLRPGALSMLTGFPADELCERVTPIGRLAAARLTTDALVAALPGTLARPRSPGQDRVLRACGLLNAAAQTPSIRSVADDVGVSERMLRSLFAQLVGLSPGMFHQVRRLQRALALGGRSLPLVEIAHRSGYSDQAHMCRQVRALTGLTPGNLMAGAACAARRPSGQCP
jgi:AraC-like DNA-binding protein